MPDSTIIEELKFAINTKTKPIGSLGRLEEIALQVGIIQNTTKPSIKAPHIVVFAADHGIAATGLVNPYPQEVTAQMVLNFINGGAAINVFCRQNKIQLKVIDAGVKYDFASRYNKDFINAKIANGTNDYNGGHAMSNEEALAAIAKGRQIVLQVSSETNCNCIGIGEMGIGNTSSASLIMSSILGLPVEDCIGCGTGTDDEQFQIKTKVLMEVYAFHELRKLSSSPLTLLSQIGGLEIAQMVGAYLEAFEEKMIIVVDGFISTAALLLAHQINPLVLENCIFAHTSSEKGHSSILNYFKVKPLLNLGLRLGEG